MSAHDYDNHHCEGSLKVRCSIRRYPAQTLGYTYRDGDWHLYQQVTDFYYDCTYMSHVTRIKHCPWFG